MYLSVSSFNCNFQVIFQAQSDIRKITFRSNVGLITKYPDDIKVKKEKNVMILYVLK